MSEAVKRSERPGQTAEWAINDRMPHADEPLFSSNRHCNMKHRQLPDKIIIRLITCQLQTPVVCLLIYRPPRQSQFQQRCPRLSSRLRRSEMDSYLAETRSASLDDAAASVMEIVPVRERSLDHRASRAEASVAANKISVYKIPRCKPPDPSGTIARLVIRHDSPFPSLPLSLRPRRSRSTPIIRLLAGIAFPSSIPRDAEQRGTLGRDKTTRPSGRRWRSERR
jgi:hypothetical protein